MTAPKPLPRVDYVSNTDPDARSAYAAGLRHLADVIESHPSCPIPSGSGLGLFLHGDAPAATAAELRRAFGGGRWSKRTSHDETDLILEGMCAGLPINIWVSRSQVCERVVVGTEEIEVPARPETVLPAVEAHTAKREIVEWRCSPLLASDDVPAAEVSA